MAAATQSNTSEAARAFGIRLEGPPPDSPELELVEVWAEHWPAVQLFGAMQTQWRHGFSGPTGLDYAALPVVEHRLGLSSRTARRAFPFLQALEAEALTWFAERRA